MKEVTVMASNGYILEEIECDTFDAKVYSTDVLYTCFVYDEPVAQFWLMDRIVQIGEV